MKYNINHSLLRSLALSVGLLSAFWFLPSGIAVAKEKKHVPAVVEVQKDIIEADGPSLKMAFNGIVSPNPWNIDTTPNPDILTTTAAAVTFMSGIDTLTVNLDE